MEPLSVALLIVVLGLVAEMRWQVARLLKKDVKFMAAIDDLTAAVTADTTVEQSAITLINNIAAQLAAAGTDPAKLSALTTTLQTNSAALAAAVAANTAPAPTAPAP